jgi:hypothetical protein
MQWVALEPGEFCSPYSLASQNNETVAQQEGYARYGGCMFCLHKKTEERSRQNNLLYRHTLASELGTRFAVKIVQLSQLRILNSNSNAVSWHKGAQTMLDQKLWILERIIHCD